VWNIEGRRRSRFIIIFLHLEGERDSRERAYFEYIESAKESKLSATIIKEGQQCDLYYSAQISCSGRKYSSPREYNESLLLRTVRFFLSPPPKEIQERNSVGV
jgi:hypothetical protein